MTCVEKKYFSRFELINTPVLVNSGFLLKRETQTYTNCCSLRARVQHSTYKNTFVKVPIPVVVSIRSNSKSGFFYARKQKRRTFTDAEFRYRSACSAPL
jgi:hypothetical protein